MTVSYYGSQPLTKDLFYQQMIDSPPAIIAIDTETIDLKEKLPIGFAIATNPHEAWWFNVLPERDLEIELLRSIMGNPNILKVYANVMFDIRVQQLLFPDFDFDEHNITDILVKARILGHTHARVTDLAGLVGREVQPAEDLLAEYNTKSMLEVPREAVASHCATDAMVTLALDNYFTPQINQLYSEGLASDYMEVESKVVPILVDMSLRGLAVDQDARARMEVRMETDRDYYKKICEEHDFNPGSGMQSGYILAKRGNFLPFTKEKKQYKTDEDTLELLDDPLAAVIIGYKKATSILTKYLYPLRGIDRLYTEYGLDTEVGRTKSSNFNMQNIPGANSLSHMDVRHIFIPDSGTFTTGDFSQEHLRIIMYMSGDAEMERVYYDDKDDGDIHLSTAKKIGKPRTVAKAVNFIIPYGRDARVLAQKLKTKDVKWCSQLIDDWMDAYPDAAEWIVAAEKYGLSHGKALPTLFGRQIAVPEEWRKTRWGKEYLDEKGMSRKSVNYPILGSDGEVMKRALIICANHNLPLAVTVHDNVTCDGDVKFPISELESIAAGVKLPFEVECSERWK